MRAIITATPTLDTSAYAANDRLGSIMTLADNCLMPGKIYVLDDLLIVDAALQSQAIDVLLFDSLPTIASADNAAINFTDAEALKLFGSISVLAANYKATVSNSYVLAANQGLFVSPQSSTGALYALAVCRSGTPTYAASSLQFRFGLRLV